MVWRFNLMPESAINLRDEFVLPIVVVVCEHGDPRQPE
jgi:hypothetical protein